MTQPNQSELDEYTDDLDFDWQRYIAANYTPNSEVAERERVARIDELRRIDKANRDNGINFWFENYEYNNGWAKMREYVPYRITELTKDKL